MDTLKYTVIDHITVLNVGAKTTQKYVKNSSKCALCESDHPTKYKGCTVYKNLISQRHSARPFFINPTQTNNHIP